MSVEFNKIGVIGAGQMGNGIAHVCALAGFDVVLNDLSPDRIKSALATINGNLARQASKNIITEAERAKAVERISAGETHDALADCDLVIETATEKEDVKRKIFAELCTVLKPEAVIGSNTSSLSITRLAASTDRPERFIGIHFMNPVPLMELVELIRGIATDDSTFDATRTFVLKLGKRIAVSEDFPAFIVNRILLPMINEAIYTLYEGVGTVEGIDTAMKLGAHPSDGPAGTGRFHRPRYRAFGDAGAPRRLGGFEIPPLSAAGEICRSGLAGPQDPARLLRLSRRNAGAHALRYVCGARRVNAALTARTRRFAFLLFGKQTGGPSSRGAVSSVASPLGCLSWLAQGGLR